MHNFKKQFVQQENILPDKDRDGKQPKCLGDGSVVS